MLISSYLSNPYNTSQQLRSTPFQTQEKLLAYSEPTSKVIITRDKEGDVEEVIMGWFQEKGIKLGNPEELVKEYESQKREGVCEECRLRMGDIHKSRLFARRNKK